VPAILADMSVRTIRRTEITVERERRILVAPPRGAPCSLCASPMLEPAAVAAIVGLGTRELYRAIERGALHFDDPPGGRLTVCLRSAAIHFEENR
jgi:hypothetical protein